MTDPATLTEPATNGHVQGLTAERLGAMLAAMPQGTADTVLATLGEHATPDERAYVGRVKFARADAAVDAGIAHRSASFEAMAFDFDADPPQPDWLIAGLIERGTVNVCSGDTGAAKSIHWQDAAVRLVHGEDWLGRSSGEPRRVLYVDEENPERVVRSRFKALGATNADRDRLRYFRRAGIRVGEPESAATRWLREECEAFAPDMLVIDTAMAATTADVNDNDSVVALYSRVLRPLAEAFGLAVVILHHERKPAAGESRHAGFAMMGARQWAGQADVHMTLATHGGYTATPLEAGEATERAFTFSVAKARDGYSTADERTVVRGVKLPSDHGGAWTLGSLRVDWEGKITTGTAEGELADDILRKMAGDERDGWKVKELAEAVGHLGRDASPDGTFKRAWQAVTEGAKPAVEVIGRTKASRARLTEAGRAKADKLGLPA